MDKYLKLAEYDFKCMNEESIKCIADRVFLQDKSYSGYEEVINIEKLLPETESIVHKLSELFELGMGRD